jgi:hypothetical protein
MKPKDLNDYVQDDIFRYGTKLEDMHKKLRQAFEEQVGSKLALRIDMSS